MLRKRMNKKGFTLVEIIVVLVILAILAAILIPSMVKWIDKAQEKSAIVAGRTMLLAAQTIASEQYAKTAGTVTFGTELLKEANDLAGFKGTGITAAKTDAKAQITDITFTASSTKVWVYTTAKGWEKQTSK